MSHIHVCLVSDQTVPNILTINHFKPDEVLFVTTDEMEKKNKTASIISTLRRLGLNYDDRHSSVIVKNDSILSCHRNIDSWIEGKEDAQFSVNLTGGTKIMSIAAYEYFKEYGSLMTYIPINRNEYFTIFPKRATYKSESLDLRLGVIEYLVSCGLEVKNEKKLEKYKREAIERSDLSSWIVKNYENLKNLLGRLSTELKGHRDDKKFYLNSSFTGSTPEEEKLLKDLGFTVKNEKITKQLCKSEICYLTGGWLEEYCFNEVLGSGIGVDDVVTGLKLMNEQRRDNEFDVMFTKDNTLYFVECKSLEQHHDKKAEILYKIGALQKEFGLKVQSFLVTTSPYILEEDGRLRESIKARAEQFRTKVIPPYKVQNFANILKKLLGDSN